MNDFRWFDPHHPQTLQIATFLLYARGVFALLAFSLPLVALYAAAAIGLANSKKWGYVVALIAAFLPFLFIPFHPSGLFSSLKFNPIGLMFDIALVALLVHPMSRDHQKIWFR